MASEPGAGGHPSAPSLSGSPDSGKSDSGKSAVKKALPKHLVEIYDVDVQLGKGAFSTVWHCVHRASGQPRAMKRIDTSELCPREIAHEIALMRLLRHENVVKCYDVFLEAQYVNIVVDLFTGGDLVDGLNLHRRSQGRVPDLQLALVTRQMVAAISHVHSLQIIHRDIKGENFLSDRPDIGDPEVRVVLSDFGTAVRIEPGQEASGIVGTPAFWAPEIFAGKYDFLVDVWAVGVTVFILLTGALPFDGEEQICRPAVPGKAPFVVPYFASRLCTSFITACLLKDRGSRPRAAEVAQHSWLSAKGAKDFGRLAGRPDPADVADGAARAIGGVADFLGACVVGCCSCLGFCLDLLLSANADEERRRREGGGADIGSGAAGGDTPNELEVDQRPFRQQSLEVEKQVTQLRSVLHHDTAVGRHQSRSRSSSSKPKLPDRAELDRPSEEGNAGRVRPGLAMQGASELSSPRQRL